MPGGVAGLITELREERGLSKAKLARLSGVSDAYIVQVEKGDRTPSQRILRKLAKGLGISAYPLLSVGGYISESEREIIGDQIAQAEKRAEEKGEEFTDEDRKSIRDSIIDGLFEYSGALDDFNYELIDLSPITTDAVIGPENWEKLSDKDQRLVQQLINRLADEDLD